MTELKSVVAYFLRETGYLKELPNSRLTKLVYLADWKHAIDHGVQLTDIKWVFNHFGPYVDDVLDVAAANPEQFETVSEQTQFGNWKRTIRLRDPSARLDLDAEKIATMQHVLKVTRGLSYDAFIKLVYSTYPVVRSERLAVLDLVSLAHEYTALLRREGVPMSSAATVS